MSEQLIGATEESSFEPLCGDVQSPQQKVKLFNSYQDAIDFLSWAKPIHAQLQTGQDQYNNPIVQLIYIKP